MKKKITTTTTTILLCTMVSACSGDDGDADTTYADAADDRAYATGDSGKPDSDTGVEADTGPEPLEGPWDCIEGNVSVNRETGQELPCGLEKCFPGPGCKAYWNLGKCESDDDCIESTGEIGWAMDCPVTCDITNLCSDMPPWLCEQL